MKRTNVEELHSLAGSVTEVWAVSPLKPWLSHEWALVPALVSEGLCRGPLQLPLLAPARSGAVPASAVSRDQGLHIDPSSSHSHGTSRSTARGWLPLAG